MEYSGQHSSDSNWTAEKNKLFENALAIYDEDIPDRWQKIAKIVGETSADEVKRRYEILVDDIASIESDKVPLPDYERDISSDGHSCNIIISNAGQRMKHLKLNGD